LRHALDNAKEPYMTESFWKKAAEKLPPEVRQRHAPAFDAADRYEPLVDWLVEAGGHARTALAFTCAAAAGGLYTVARTLEAAARRLSLR
jgi:hypothetical protein